MAVERDGTAGARQRAVQHLHQLRASGPHQPGDAENFALTKGKGHIFNARSAQIVHLQTNRTGRFIQVRVLIFQLAANHHFDQQIFIQTGYLALGDKLPVAKDRHIIANLEDLFHTVRDIDNSAPLRLQLADDAEQRFRFGIGQCVRWFIHNDDLRLKAQHLGDFNHLLIANRQIAHQLLAVKA